MIEFKAWPKMPRLNRDAVVTEKIDGTNAAIGIVGREHPNLAKANPDEYKEIVTEDGRELALYAQSRNKIITPGKKTDNAGFAGWAWDNAEKLTNTLDLGLHFGEWWGKGIQRGYDMDHKVFSLFNTAKWGDFFYSPKLSGQLSCVPTLFIGTFANAVADQFGWIHALETLGSKAAPGYYNPEGICIYSTSANISFKVTREHDGISKTEASTS